MVAIESPVDRYGDGYDSYEPRLSPAKSVSTIHWIAMAVLVFVLLGSYGSWNSTTETQVAQFPRVRENDMLVLYAYYETEEARINAEFFLKHGLHSTADFLFVLNGETTLEELLPKNSTNVQFIKKANECYDMGSYGQVLGADNQALIKKYSRFILINASVRGPFLPTWSRECWSDAYANMVTDEVKLVGMTYNCSPIPHVQSMVLATDRVGIKLLVDGLLSDCPATFEDAMLQERLATPLIVDAGYKVDVMMTAFKGASDEYTSTNCLHGDPLFNGNLFGTNVHPFETVFMKTSRGVAPEVLKALTDWATHSKYSSWDKCHF